MLKGTKGLVENVQIRKVGALGIVIGNDPEWPEGAIPSEITLRNISVEGIGFSRWYGALDRGAAIQVLTKVLEGRSPASRGVRNIILENCSIVEPPGSALLIDGAEEIYIKDLDVRYTEGQKLPRPCSAVDIRNAGKVVAEQLSIDARPSLVSAGISLAPSVDADEKGWILNEYFFQGTSPSEAIHDQR